jgi:hypothetical protein
VEKFLSVRDHTATTPHGGALLFLHALLAYSQPASAAEGRQMLVRSVRWRRGAARCRPSSSPRRLLPPHPRLRVFLTASLCPPTSRPQVLSLWEETLVPGEVYKGWALAPGDEGRLVAAAAPPNDFLARSYVAGAVPGKGGAQGAACWPRQKRRRAGAAAAAKRWLVSGCKALCCGFAA